MLDKFCVAVIITIFLATNIFAQTPPYYHYTSSDGLVSSTVYEIIQDKDGFIWFATANGISKFDGKRFTTFRTKDGLSSNSIISIVEGMEGKIYAGNYETGIDVLQNGSIKSYCREINGKRIAISYLLFVSSKNNKQILYAYTKSGAINSIIEKENGGLSTSIFSSSPVYISKLEKEQDGNILALTSAGLFNYNNEKLVRRIVAGLPESWLYSYARNADSAFYIGARGKIYRIKNKKIIKTYNINIAGSNDVVAMLCDRNGNLWFSIMNKGFYLIPHDSDKIINIGKKMDLQNTLVNNFLEDNEGNIWISTFGNGVYCLNNLYLKNYNESDGLSNNNIYSIVKDNSGKLIIGTFNKVNIFDNGKFEFVKSNSKKTTNEYIYGIKKYDTSYYIGGSFGNKKIINITHKGIKFHLFDNPSFCKTSNRLYIFGTYGNSILVKKEFNGISGNDSPFYIFGNNPSINRINIIFEDSKKNIWIATALGVCKIPKGFKTMEPATWRKIFFSDDPVLSSKIVSIYQDNQNNVWFAGTKGIAKYNLISDSVSSYNNILGNDLTSSNAIVSDDKNRIWIGNMNGLYLYDGSTIKYLNSRTGLPSNEVLSLCFDDDKNLMYIGTSNGISVLDVNLFDSYKRNSLKIKIMSVKAGDSVYTNFNNLVFSPAQRNVYIDFKALSFSSSGSVRYKYNLNSRWIETDHDFLDFISLDKGYYNLQIMAKAQNVGWGEPYTLKFQVLPKFVETIWFNLLIITTILVLFLIIFTWRIKLNYKKTTEKLEISERINDLKHQALAAMMNPHFTFNALNSVQFLINDNRKEEANDYIAMMAQLIRKNLDTAGKGFILLSEEIKRLKLYLNIEKLRFQENFSYEIIMGNNINPIEILIPNMIIQPFVENTLWHGIINSGKKGLITISFSFEEIDINEVISQALIIKISDNGIGINEAKKHKKGDHISKGIEIIEERLRLLSTKMELPKPIMFEDLSNRSNDSHGTEVIISLPIPLYKIITPEQNTSPALTD